MYGKRGQRTLHWKVKHELFLQAKASKSMGMKGSESQVQAASRLRKAHCTKELQWWENDGIIGCWSGGLNCQQNWKIVVQNFFYQFKPNPIYLYTRGKPAFHARIKAGEYQWWMLMCRWRFKIGQPFRSSHHEWKCNLACVKFDASSFLLDRQPAKHE